LRVLGVYVKKCEVSRAITRSRFIKHAKAKRAVASANEGPITYQFSCLWSKWFLRSSANKGFSKKVE
jgi:hypothetical protein